VTAAGLIVNPVSGAGTDAHAAEHRLALAREVASACGVTLHTAVTSHQGHARALAAAFRADGLPLVVVWGGDGTVNEVASSVAGSSTALAIVPSGSGNGLATELRFPRAPREALVAAFQGRDRVIDAGEINGRLFVNLAGIGFDGHVAHRFQALSQGRRGALRYLTIALRSVWRYRPPDYAIELDADRLHTPALLMVFANGCQYGNNAVIAPLARVDDGRLDAVVVKAWPAIANFARLHHLFLRSAHRAPGVISRQVATARVRADTSMDIHVDGEMVEPSKVAEVRVIPGAIRLRVPVSTSEGRARGTWR